MNYYCKRFCKRNTIYLTSGRERILRSSVMKCNDVQIAATSTIFILCFYFNISYNLNTRQIETNYLAVEKAEPK